jgi:predicted  nucleic acid-binding Zn-ribbon protein
MPRCVHCGEPVNKGQERCFACGQKARGRVRSGEKPVNPFIFLFAGALVVAAIVGIIAVNSGRARRTRAEVHQQEQARIKDSVRAAAQVRRDSAKATARSDAAGILADEVNKLEQRFDIVRQQVVKDQPSPAQAKLISEIRSEVVRLRQLTGTIADQPGPKGDSLKVQLRDGERAVRTRISDLSRAPKK